MALMKFFKTPKNQKFDYKPRYWDPKKEELRERLSKYREETKGDTKAVKSRIANGFKRRGGLGYKETREIRTKELRRSNRVLLITVIVLALLAYVLFEVYLTEIVNMME